MRILVVEDNRDLAANLLDYLALKSCVVDWANNGHHALTLVSQHAFDLVVLDIMMPGMDGLEVCRQLRQQQLDIPILFLTARDALDDKIEGFNAGGDDYLVKPFAMEELFVRIQALYRRAQRLHSRQLTVGDLTLDLTRYEVSRAGQAIHLTRFGMKLLQCLMQHAPDVVPRETLVYALWGDDEPDQDVLRSHLYQLRSAIDKPFSTPLLHTVYGVGFRLAVLPAEG